MLTLSLWVCSCAGFSCQSVLSLFLSVCSHPSEAAAGCLGVSVTSHWGHATSFTEGTLAQLCTAQPLETTVLHVHVCVHVRFPLTHSASTLNLASISFGVEQIKKKKLPEEIFFGARAVKSVGASLPHKEWFFAVWCDVFLFKDMKRGKKCAAVITNSALGYSSLLLLDFECF